jgi:putative hydrolase of the HAD superfamily
MTNYHIQCLFLDIGGVLLTNGWDHHLRQATSVKFGFDLEESTRRHELVFDLFERGHLSFDDYLHWTIFYEQRPFSLEQVKSFILNAAKPHTHMIEYVKHLKSLYGLKIGVVSNEGREIAIDRIDRFQLRHFIDFFVVSSFVHLRKPDHKIYKMAIDIAAMPPSDICYIDDRPLLIEAASYLGMHCIHHTTVANTKKFVDNFFEHAPLSS